MPNCQILPSKPNLLKEIVKTHIEKQRKESIKPKYEIFNRSAKSNNPLKNQFDLSKLAPHQTAQNKPEQNTLNGGQIKTSILNDLQRYLIKHKKEDEEGNESQLQEKK